MRSLSQPEQQKNLKELIGAVILQFVCSSMRLLLGFMEDDLITKPKELPGPYLASRLTLTLEHMKHQKIIVV